MGNDKRNKHVKRYKEPDNNSWTRNFGFIIKRFEQHKIAEILFISRNTVDFHRRQLLRKTESKNIAELIGNAYRQGILSK